MANPMLNSCCSNVVVQVCRHPLTVGKCQQFPVALALSEMQCKGGVLGEH